MGRCDDKCSTPFIYLELHLVWEVWLERLSAYSSHAQWLFLTHPGVVLDTCGTGKWTNLEHSPKSWTFRSTLGRNLQAYEMGGYLELGLGCRRAEEPTLQQTAPHQKP